MARTKQLNIFNRITEFALYSVIFFIPISIALTNIAIGLAIISWLISKFLSRKFYLKKTPINIFLFLISLISAISIANSLDIISSLGGLQKIAKYIFLFFIIAETIDDKKKLKKAVLFGILGLTLVSIDGVFQFFRGVDFIRGYPLPQTPWFRYGDFTTPRIRASMHNPNDFSCYLISLIPLVMVLFLYYVKFRLILGIIFILGFFCMFNTYFRGAGLGFGVAVILLGLIKKNKKIIIGFLIFLLILPFVLPKPILMWLASNLNPYNFFVEDMGRRQHWQTALNMIKQHPFFGIGINTFSISYAKYKSGNDPFVGFYGHNAYLHLAGELGLVGLGTFILMLIVIIKKWIDYYKNQKDNELKEISLGLFLGWLGFLIAGLLESILQISNLAVLFWFITGLIVAVTKIGD